MVNIGNPVGVRIACYRRDDLAQKNPAQASFPDDPGFRFSPSLEFFLTVHEVQTFGGSWAATDHLLSIGLVSIFSVPPPHSRVSQPQMNRATTSPLARGRRDFGKQALVFLSCCAALLPSGIRKVGVSHYHPLLLCLRKPANRVAPPLADYDLFAILCYSGGFMCAIVGLNIVCSSLSFSILATGLCSVFVCWLVGRARAALALRNRRSLPICFIGGRPHSFKS